MAQKILTVFGATGNQGGSVIKAILASQSLSSVYKIRAVTRDTTKPAAKALADKGAETVKADLDDPESLASAVEGSYAVYAVTNYWEKATKEGEIAQGKAIADASKKAGVKHLIWSSLPKAGKLTQGKLARVEHFDSKAEVQDYIESIKGDMVASYVLPAYFMSNITSGIRPGQDGTLAWTLPLHPTETQIPLIDIREDTGKFVAGLLAKGAEANGIKVHAVSEWSTPQKVVDTVSKVTGKPIKFNQIPETVWKGFLPMPDHLAEELMENMVLIRDYSYFGLGEEKNQDQSDKWLLEGTQKVSIEEWAKNVHWEL